MKEKDDHQVSPLREYMIHVFFICRQLYMLGREIALLCSLCRLSMTLKKYATCNVNKW